MKISEIAVKNVRALPDLARRLADASKRPFDVVLITGSTGSGKTRLLQAIAAWKETVGPYGIAPGFAGWERRAGEGGWIEGVWELTEDEVRRGQLAGATVTARVEIGAKAAAPSVPAGLRKVLSAFFREETHGKVEYFPASRRLAAAPLPVPLEALTEKLEAATRLGADEAKYGIERAWLSARLAADLAAAGSTLSNRGVLLSGQAPDSLAGVRAAIARLAPHLRLLGLSPDGPRPTARFLRAGGAEVDLDGLSSGEEQAVLFALAFHRLALSRSVVLVDTPELHVHPSDHARFFRELTALGKDNQIIAATCSQGILATVPPEQIIDLDAAPRAEQRT
jgi:energy-coupling factor transporter ATP-binding protein EcfA2